MYKVTLEQFSGPLDLLLHLIEKQELDISRISITKVTDEFLNYLDKFQKEEPSEIADFLYLAAKLVYIKSTILLPYINPEEEKEVLDLEKGLRLYQEFKEATRLIKKILAKENVLFSREKFFLSGNFFVPPKKLKIEELFRAFTVIVKDLEKEKMIVQKIRKRTISLADKIVEMRNMLRQVESLELVSYIKNKKNKTDVVFSFLAILELVKNGIVELKQDKIFGEIMVSNLEKI